MEGCHCQFLGTWVWSNPEPAIPVYTRLAMRFLTGWLRHRRKLPQVMEKLQGPQDQAHQLGQLLA
ncbi:hypothetical protein HaLaN_08307, partial [Haematococcus lacustris]